MAGIQRVLDTLAHWLLVLAGCALIGMMLVTMFDVVVRNLGTVVPSLQNLNYYGTIEIVRYLFLLAMAGAMPWGVEKSQVIVELFTQRLAPAARARIDALFLLGFAAFGAMLAYSLFVSGLHAAASGETTPDLLIPMGPIKYGAAFCMALMALRALVVALAGGYKGDAHVG